MAEEPKIITQKDFPEVIKCVNHMQVGQLAYPESDLASSSWIDTVNENYDTHIIAAAIQVQSELALKQAMKGLSFAFMGIVALSSKKKPPINWFSDELNALYSELDLDCKDMMMPLFLSNSYFDSWFSEKDNKKLKERGYESYHALFKKAYVHLLKGDDLTFSKMKKAALKRFPNITTFPLLLKSLEKSDGEKLLSTEEAKKEMKVFVKNAKKEEKKKGKETEKLELKWEKTSLGQSYYKEVDAITDKTLINPTKYRDSKWFWICGLIMFGYPLYFIFGIMSGYPPIGPIFGFSNINLDMGLFFGLPIIWTFFFTDLIIYRDKTDLYLTATEKLREKYKEEKEAFFAEAQKEMRQKEELKKAKKKSVNLKT